MLAKLISVTSAQEGLKLKGKHIIMEIDDGEECRIIQRKCDFKNFLTKYNTIPSIYDTICQEMIR